jgi:hypothetical protein
MQSAAEHTHLLGQVAKTICFRSTEPFLQDGLALQNSISNQFLQRRSHLFLLQPAIALRFAMGKAIVFIWVGRDAILL